MPLHAKNIRNVGFVHPSRNRDLLPYIRPAALHSCPACVSQVSDQTWTKGNAALKASHEQGTHVRLMRRVNATQYSYDGLYRVTEVRPPAHACHP